MRVPLLERRFYHLLSIYSKHRPKHFNCLSNSNGPFSNNAISKNKIPLYFSTCSTNYQTQKAKQNVGVQNHTLLEKFVAKCHPDVQPYLKIIRFDKPTGTLLLLWPCYWSLSLATSPGCFPDPSLLALFAAGAFFMRGAGCIINDLWDKDIDSKVFRTKSRPLACGDLSTLDAWMLLGGKLSVALLLLLQLNWYSIVLGSTSLALVIAYPLMKRITYYPQMVLGMTFNWGALLGWSSLHGHCDWSIVLPLYLACISWTVIYDTIYAHQDKVDDLLLNIKSAAIKFGDNTKYYLSGFSTAMVGFLLLAGYSSHQTWPFYTSVGLTAALLTTQVAFLDINSNQSCWKAFKSNQRIGLIIFLGILGGTLLKEQKDCNHKSNSIIGESLLPTSNLVASKAFS